MITLQKPEKSCVNGDRNIKKQSKKKFKWWVLIKSKKYALFCHIKPKLNGYHKSQCTFLSNLTWDVMLTR